ncbi:preprotein translocase subunit SecY [Caldinitratiruptor microaerophilus]|uniref:Protein translocase subunit SecY n=1 Tax=Caldinitratiruptor microaerophilus TaxID=671077 RepID=A0AA35G9I8_9FIRM|nr:preprotein translocase subunit SecY [Caldinitratiruptor microaerophilus]BDG62240.1 protein translocase subunit SecY [Caldinitratiruptor microaerophilus]
MALIDTVRASLRTPGLRRRILITIAMLLVFRVGAHIPVPGVRADVIEQLFRGGGGLLGLIDVISGGAFRTFSIFAMSVIPYINASIIMQLLTVVIPRLEELQKEGEEGRRKIQEYVRYGTVVLAVVQGFGTAVFVRNQGALVSGSWGWVALIVLSLTAGTAFLMWVGEQITEHGIGNGISLLIFASIVSRVPAALVGMAELVRTGALNVLQVLAVIVLAILIVAFTVVVTEGVRKVPVQYAKRVVGRRLYGGQSTHLPMKVNQAGVIPVIFAQSLLVFPVTVANFFSQTHPVVMFINRWLGFQSPIYLLLFGLLTFLFTFFYTEITFQPDQVADNIKKAGGFIPGLRPGRPTAEYLARVSSRITFVGALFLAAITLLPYGIIAITGVQQAYIGGTSLLIVVGVAIETMRQVEAHLVLRQYQGFMK